MLLDNLPHLATAYKRIRKKDALGGPVDDYSTIVFSDRACWEQQLSTKEIKEFAKQDVEATHKIYFILDPGLDTGHLVKVTNTLSGRTTTMEVKQTHSPDSSAGLGVVWKVVGRQTTSGTPVIA